MSAKNTVLVYGLGRRSRLRLAVEKIAESALGHFRIKSKTLDIIFLGNKEMVALKRRYLKNKKGPANTLSFEAGERFPDPQNPRESLGEIFINTKLTQFDIDKISPLLIHSILHVLGYHHGHERDKIEMDRLAHKLEKALKV